MSGLRAHSLFMYLISIFMLMFSLNAFAEGQVTGSKRTTVKDHRYMQSDVTMYKNGHLVISTESWSKKRFGGLKGQSAFVVCVDKNGNAIWVSKAYKMTTIGGTADPTTPSAHTDVHEESTPAAIGKNTHTIDIYHDAGDISQSRSSQLKAVKDAVGAAADITKEVKDAILNTLE